MDESPARHTISLQTIRSRKNELLSSAAKFDALAAKARAEAADFEAAERVWLKMVPEAEVASGADFLLEQHSAGRAGRLLETLQRKPSGTPPMPDMIIEALTDAAERGAPGLTPAGLLSFVKGRHWPEAQSNDVGSAAWRMWKDGRLIKPHPESPIYALPGAKSSPPEPLEAEQEAIPG